MKNSKNNNWVSAPNIDYSVFCNHIKMTEKPSADEIKQAIQNRLYFNDASFYRGFLCAKMILVDGMKKCEAAKVIGVSNSLVMVIVSKFLRHFGWEIEKVRRLAQQEKQLKNACDVNEGSKIDDVFDFSVRVLNALKSEGIYTVKDILRTTKADLHQFRNLGKKSIREIDTEIKKALGVTLKDNSWI